MINNIFLCHAQFQEHKFLHFPWKLYFSVVTTFSKSFQVVHCLLFLIAKCRRFLNKLLADEELPVTTTTIIHPQSLATMNLFSISIILLFQEGYINEIIQSVTLLKNPSLFPWISPRLLHSSIFCSFYCLVLFLGLDRPQWVDLFTHWRITG